MSAEVIAAVWTKNAIKDYEQETGITVAGCAVLEEIFSVIYIKSICSKRRLVRGSSAESYRMRKAKL